MPPAKKVVAQDDSSSSSKPVAGPGRGKQVATSSAQAGSALKDAVSMEDGRNHTPSAGLSWNTEDLSLLESYRRAHRLDTPSAFQSPYNRALLTNPGIGRSSPTMVKKRKQRSVSKDQLALAVRKNFNSAAVNETNVAVDLLYKIRYQDKAFRIRSNPAKAKTTT